MPKLATRILAALALVGLLQPTRAITLADADSDFTRCIMSCNETRKACQDRCKIDCRELFPDSDDAAQRDACVAACTADCGAASEECKLGCQREPSPDEP
jgi:hypothetical protein